jgi:hypothetical protein
MIFGKLIMKIIDILKSTKIYWVVNDRAGKRAGVLCGELYALARGLFNSVFGVYGRVG